MHQYSAWREAGCPGRYAASTPGCKLLSPVSGWLSVPLRAMGAGILLSPGKALQAVAAAAGPPRIRRSPCAKGVVAPGQPVRPMLWPPSSPCPAWPSPAPWSLLTMGGQRPAAPRAVIRAAGSRSGAVAVLTLSRAPSLAGRCAVGSRAEGRVAVRTTESGGGAEKTQANFHFPRAERLWPALGTAF